jgi:hypothetical protein
MPVFTRKSPHHQHVEWIDLKGNGVIVECAVMKRDDFGNIYYVDISSLDKIDKTRLAKMLASRHAKTFPLWDLMNSTTLNNGMNALTYFHQLVKVITPEGVVMNPRQGQIGVGRVDIKNALELQANIASAQLAEQQKTNPK